MDKYILYIFFREICCWLVYCVYLYFCREENSDNIIGFWGLMIIFGILVIDWGKIVIIVC